MRSFDFQDLSQSQAYRFLIGTILPRPIAWITTLGQSGQVNLAPFSFFMGVSSDPACVAFSIAPKSDGSPKDTLRNLRQTSELTLNFAHETLLQEVHESALPLPYEESEVLHLGLETLPGVKHSVPRLAASKIHLESRLFHQIQIGEENRPGSSTLVIAQVLALHVAPEILEERTTPRGVVYELNEEKLKPLSRLGKNLYGGVTRIDLPKDLHSRN